MEPELVLGWILHFFNICSLLHLYSYDGKTNIHFCDFFAIQVRDLQRFYYLIRCPDKSDQMDKSRITYIISCLQAISFCYTKIKKYSQEYFLILCAFVYVRDLLSLAWVHNSWINFNSLIRFLIWHFCEIKKHSCPPFMVDLSLHTNLGLPWLI